MARLCVAYVGPEPFDRTALIGSDRCQSILFLSVYQIVRGGHIPSESVE